MPVISIEGNIGSGKSTILNILKSKLSDVIFIDEPVDEWFKIKDNNNKNMLELFYNNKNKYSFVFQITAYITRLRKLIEILKDNNDKIIICERSIYTDKYVFAKMLYQDKFINDIEWNSYNYWFDTFKEISKLDGIIYVNTKPDICFDRIKKRNRNGESNISLDYLNNCHQKHLDWISKESNVLDIDGNQEFENNDLLIQNILNQTNSFILN